MQDIYLEKNLTWLLFQLTLYNKSLSGSYIKSTSGLAAQSACQIILAKTK